MSTADQPRGRVAVRAALIEAATALFAERGPALVSVRDVAAKARVNHGLVHRHFGSKEGLVVAVMETLAQLVSDALGPETPDETLDELLPRALGSTRAQAAHWRIVAHSILVGQDPTAIQQEFPVIHRLLAAARREPTGDTSPEARVALLVTTGLGIMMFEPFVCTAIGSDGPTWRKVRNEMLAMTARRSGVD